MPNKLIHARSHYLTKAAHQPVDWHEWGEEAFSIAAREDKPIFLSIGGVWCHWCHVMAHESFEDPVIADLINRNFVPVKVDRDERPDIDRRYQDFVVRISGNGGWPLTVFLTPDGKAFFGGTYFPPEDRWQRPGLSTLITKLIEVYRNDRWRIVNAADEFFKSAQRVHQGSDKGDLDESLIRTKVDVVMSSMDMSHGGFGSAPKFHHASAIEFLIYYSYFYPDGAIRDAVTLTLDKMAAGGIYDHLLGGFFRYSTDEKWIVPHFEKMLADNAELLNLYSVAHAIFGGEGYRSVAEGIVKYYDKFGTSEEGGFYASQDADIGSLDEGGHYTFSPEDLDQILSDDEKRVISLHLGIRPTNEMPDHFPRSVPHIDNTPAAIADLTGLRIDAVKDLIASAMGRMLRYREESREHPFVDRAIYTNWNGLMIEALCRAGAILGNSDYIVRAQRAAEHILTAHYRDGVLYHHRTTEGFAEDYVFLAKGLINLYQLTRDDRYCDAAAELMEKAIALFWEDDNWGFLDSRAKGPGYLAIGVRNIQDTPTQSLNGIAPLVLLQLHSLTGRQQFSEYAEKALQAFGDLARQYPHATDSYFISLLAYFRGLYKIETAQFFDEAIRDFKPYKLVVHRDVDGAMVCVKEACRIYDSYPVDDGRIRH